MSASADTIPVLIRQIRQEAQDIHSFELVAADGGLLPGFEAGAHVDLALPERMRRSYSLYGAPGERRCWRIAVKREAAGRGASAWLHDHARVGQTLQAFAPVNDFPLVEGAPASVLIAGGIGVTPVLAMIERLSALRRPWRLHYSVRSAHDLAFGERLDTLARASSTSAKSLAGALACRRCPTRATSCSQAEAPRPAASRLTAMRQQRRSPGAPYSE